VGGVRRLACSGVVCDLSIRCTPWTYATRHRHPLFDEKDLPFLSSHLTFPFAFTPTLTPTHTYMHTHIRMQTNAHNCQHHSPSSPLVLILIPGDDVWGGLS
jgi:hypothetical protein